MWAEGTSRAPSRRAAVLAGVVTLLLLLACGRWRMASTYWRDAERALIAYHDQGVIAARAGGGGGGRAGGGGVCWSSRLGQAVAAREQLRRARADAAAAVSAAAQQLQWAREHPGQLGRQGVPNCAPGAGQGAEGGEEEEEARDEFHVWDAGAVASAAGRYPPEAARALEALDFRVFIYPLPEEFHSALLQTQKRCISDQYGTEISIHEELLKSRVRTLDPEEADFFYVPIYGECHLYQQTRLSGKLGKKVTNLWYLEALRIVKQAYPFYNRSNGRDHVWTFPGARGPHIFADWKKQIKKNIFLCPEGDRSLGSYTPRWRFSGAVGVLCANHKSREKAFFREQFNTWKDVIIPGLEYDSHFWDGKLRSEEHRRDTFAFFKGTIHNKEGKSYSRGIRIEMETALRGAPDVVFTQYQPNCDHVCYAKQMRRSVFCLCPRGWSPWTLRAYQAMMVGCIPVILADEIELPFENSLNWSNLTVKIRESQAAQVLDILRSITPEEIAEKQAAIARVWRMVSYPRPSRPDDAFHAILRELGRKRRRMKHSNTEHWS